MFTNTDSVIDASTYHERKTICIKDLEAIPALLTSTDYCASDVTRDALRST